MNRKRLTWVDVVTIIIFLIFFVFLAAFYGWPLLMHGFVDGNGPVNLFIGMPWI